MSRTSAMGAVDYAERVAAMRAARRIELHCAPFCHGPGSRENMKPPLA